VLANGTVAVGSAPEDVGEATGTESEEGAGDSDAIEDGRADATDTPLPTGAEAGAEETNVAK
jgi:hypothetical protein